MDCPVCIQPMDELEFYGVKVDACRFCGGVWFDGGEIVELIKKGKVPKRVLKPIALTDETRVVQEGERNCPRCGRKLEVVNHRGVKVDYCTVCRGMWFDRGELMEVIRGYVGEFDGKNKRKAFEELPPEDAEDGEEIIRITEAGGVIEYRENVAKKDDEPSNVVEDVIDEEILSAATKEEILKALPKGVLKKEKPRVSIPPSLEGMQPNMSGIEILSADVSPMGGGHGATDFILDVLSSFMASFNRSRW